MPTRRSRTALAPGLLLAGVLAGCTASSDGTEPDAVPSASPAELVEVDPAAAVGAMTETLDARARAVRRGEVGAFVDGTDPTARGQRRYARNLVQLPFEVFRYALDPDSVTRTGDDTVSARAVLTTRLDPYDAAPTRAERELVFRLDAEGRALVARDRPVSDDPSRGGAQPWDTGTATVRREDGVLGVFDPGSIDAAATITDAAADAVSEVLARVPGDWSGDVVVYAPSDTRLLDALSGLPGGVADRLDGVAFTVGAADGERVAAERVVLHPRMLAAEEVERDRLLRHELVHVALGDRDEQIPTWLSEGVAEWVSVQPLAPGDRLISEAALDAAREGVDELPDDASFNTGPRSGANYGIAWQVCEEVAGIYGEDALWTLVEAMQIRGDRTPEQVLRRVLGMSGEELATGAAERIVAAYG